MCFARFFWRALFPFWSHFRIMTPIVVDDHRPQGRGAYVSIHRWDRLDAATQYPHTSLIHTFAREHSLHQPAGHSVPAEVAAVDINIYILCLNTYHFKGYGSTIWSSVSVLRLLGGLPTSTSSPRSTAASICLADCSLSLVLLSLESACILPSLLRMIF